MAETTLTDAPVHEAGATADGAITLETLRAELEALRHENAVLRERAAEAQETLAAIRRGEVDALVVGDDVYILDTAHAAINQLRKTVLSQMQDAVIASNREGHIVYLNPAAERRYGFGSGDALGRRRDELFAEHLLGAPAASVGHTPRIVQALHSQPGGKHWHVESTVSTLYDEAGQPRGEIAVVRDVTARLRAEEQLRQAMQALARREHQFATLVENSPDLTARFDRGLRHRYVNPALEAVTGRPAADFLGKTHAQFGASPESCERWTAALESVFSDREPVRMRFTLCDATGQLRHYESRLVPEFADDGSVESVLAVASDETERHQLDQAREASARALRETDLRKNEFLAMLSHELRTPLAPITHALEILRRAPEGPRREAARQTLDRQVRQMVRLVDDLLDVNRIGQGKLHLRRATLDLHAVVQQAIETSQPLIDSGGHLLELQLPPPGELMVDGDLPRLTQVVANVLGNAAKYTPPHGRITLTAAREFDHAVITVIDSGMGIAGDMLPRIFDLFTQADAGPDRAQGGLGIGLALVKKLVDLHGGSVSAHSDGVGRGSRFTLTLPLLQEGAAREAPAPAPAPVARAGESAVTASPSAAEQRCVLIVDDNVDSAQTLAELMRMSGFQPHVAHDGSRAIQLAEECRPDVALLDIGLPGMDGHEIARRIRTRPWGSQALLIALSGWGSDGDQRRSLDAGFDHHLVKPVVLDALFDLLERQPRPGRPAVAETTSPAPR